MVRFRAMIKKWRMWLAFKIMPVDFSKTLVYDRENPEGTPTVFSYTDSAFQPVARTTPKPPPPKVTRLNRVALAREAYLSTKYGDPLNAPNR
jgi:hypothetical protein